MMNTMRAGKGVPQWAQNDLQAHIAFMIGLNKELRQSGEFVSCEGLSFPDQAKLVRAGKDGVPITDGVFPESDLANLPCRRPYFRDRPVNVILLWVRVISSIHHFSIINSVNPHPQCRDSRVHRIGTEFRARSEDHPCAQL
jgi:hypothetical protein